MLAFKRGEAVALTVIGQMLLGASPVWAGQTNFKTDPEMQVPAEAQARLHISLKGVRVAPGPLYLRLQTEDQFMGDDFVAGEAKMITQPGDYDYSFNVPPGDYAINVWHDIDNDNKFNMKLFVMPDEGWSMSGEKLRGRPTFDRTRVTLSAGDNDITMTMTYP